MCECVCVSALRGMFHGCHVPCFNIVAWGMMYPRKLWLKDFDIKDKSCERCDQNEVALFERDLTNSNIYHIRYSLALLISKKQWSKQGLKMYHNGS